MSAIRAASLLPPRGLSLPGRGDCDDEAARLRILGRRGAARLVVADRCRR
jgi:hypothetical protein